MMRCLFLVTATLATLAGTAAAETVWEFPFEELGASWTTGFGWTMEETGGTFEVAKLRNGVDWIYHEFRSGTMTVPEGFDSLLIWSDQMYEYSGWAMDGGSHISMLAEAVLQGTSYEMMFVEDGVDCYNYQSYDGSDTTPIEYGLPAAPGYELELVFTSGLNGYGYMYDMALYWSLSNMTITGFDGTPLRRSTWGALKAARTRTEAEGE